MSIFLTDDDKNFIREIMAIIENMVRRITASVDGLTQVIKDKKLKME